MLQDYIRIRQLNSLNYIIVPRYGKYYNYFNRECTYFQKSEKVTAMI